MCPVVELRKGTQKPRFIKLSKPPFAPSVLYVPLHGFRNKVRHQELSTDLADLCPLPFPTTRYLLNIPPEVPTTEHMRCSTHSKNVSWKPGDRILRNRSYFFLLSFTALGGGSLRSI